MIASANDKLITELCVLTEQLHYWKEKAEHLEELALIDELTNCGNRRKFDADLASAWAKCSRENTNISIVYFDLDGLKAANDSYGHDYGDNFIVGAAEAVKRVLRPYDQLYRWGGDEFAVILSRVDLETAKVIADRVRMAVAGVRDNDGRFFGSASVGVATTSPVFSAVDNLIKKADFAQKDAKQSGKNRVCC